MCGYCVESAYFEGRSIATATPAWHRHLHYVHLQESPDWFAYHQSCPEDASPSAI